MNKIIVSLAVLFMLGACAFGTNSDRNSEQKNPEPMRATSTMEPTAGLFPSQVLPTPSVELTPTSTKTPEVHKHNVTLETGIDSYPEWNGTLLAYSNNSNQFELVSLSDFIRMPIPGKNPHLGLEPGFSISPNRTRVSYLVDEETSEMQYLRIIDGYGSVQSLPNWPKEGVWDVINWLDNRRLALANLDEAEGTVFVYDTTSGDMDELTPFFPFDSDEGKLVRLPLLVFVYYNAQLTRLVTVRENQAGSSLRINYSLWDRDSRTMLWTLSGSVWSDERPVWSDSGVQFILGLAPEANQSGENESCKVLYLVSDNGDQELLNDCIWGSSSWSVDEKYIASWQVVQEKTCSSFESEVELVVLNVETGEKDIFVICSDANKGGISLSQYPVWSPDGRFIAFNRYDGNLLPVGAAVLDLAQRRVYELQDIDEILGWMCESGL